jgi:glycosyltransferase involved in cell wall biosynthesis
LEAGYAVAITVLTPTFNRAHTLPRAYASLEAQAFRDFEWIVVDDGSTDDTAALIESQRKVATFPVRYMWQENSGKHVARNRAVDLAAGRFFLGLDSDDWLLPVALQRLMEMWETIPAARRADFIGVAGRCARPDGALIGDALPSPVLDSDEVELRGRYRVTGDNAGMNRIDVLRRFALPENAGEVFVPEAVVQNRIARHYKTRYFDEVLEIRDFQRGGLTDRSRLIRSENVTGSLQYYGELLTMRDRLGLRARIRASANFTRYSLHGGRRIWQTRGDIDIWTWMLSLPAAVVLWAGDGWAKRKGRA